MLSSALIDAWTKWYSPETIPHFWDKIEELARAGNLTLPDAVLLELSVKDDDLYKWCHERKDFICTPSIQEIQDLLKRIANNYPNLRGGSQNKNFADPFVIAVAEYYHCIVITHEEATGNLSGPRIPDICRDKMIRVMQFHHLIREQGWRF